MSNIIKSFRVIEREPIEQVNSIDIEENIIKEVLLYEARIEAEMIIKIAREQSKVILEDQYKLIIDEAEAKKEKLINSAYEKSIEILEDAKESGYKEGYANGHSEGYEKGYSEGKYISDNLINEALEIKNGYIDTKTNLLKELEEDIIELIINIYEKILGNVIDEDMNMITSLVLNGIQNFDPTDKLTIRVSKEDFNILESSRDKILAKASLIKELEIKYDINLEKGDCILETAKGNIDLSIKDQLTEVRELLTTILNNE